MNEGEDRAAPQPASPANGIEQLRAMIASGRFAPIAETLGFDLAEVEEGRVVFTATPHRGIYNPIGSAHGGYAATLLDSACGCAVQSRLSAEQAYTTLELKISYLRPITDDSGPIRAEGRTVRVGRRAAFAEATLSDSDGTLLATATSTLLVFDRAPARIPGHEPPPPPRVLNVLQAE